MADLEKLLERLVEHRVEFVVVGGYAAVLHGASYVTFDVDVCCPFDRPNLEKIHAACFGLHAFHRMTPQELPFDLRPEFERGLKNLYLKTDLGQIDFLGSILGVGDYHAVKAHSIPVSLPTVDISLLDCAALIQAKESLGRDKDLLVAKQLRAILETFPPNPKSSL